MSRDPSFDEATLAAERRVGTVLAEKWKLDKLLGVGGMAAVYSATHQNNGKTFALKVLHPTLAMQAEIKKRFLREGYIANKVGHPGAVSIIDDGSDPDGSVFLVMALLEGDSLRALAESRRGRMAPKELLPYVIDVLDVLDAAHAQGIVHRDLKADNVFITKDGKAKVLDFGVARVLEGEGGKTRTGMVMGTPEYMPPEQARGRSELIDGRADLWAVGAMIYRLLSGRYPHEAETPNEVLLLAMTEPAPKLASAVPDAAPKLQTLVDKAMAFDKNDRWADARAMQAAAREALEEVKGREAATTAVTDLATLAVESAKTLPAEPSPKGLWLHDKATPPASTQEPPKKKKRGALGLVLAAVVLALVAGGVWLGVRHLRTSVDDALADLADAAPSASVLPLANAPDASEDATDDGDLDIDEDNPYADWEGGALAPDSGAAKPVATVKPLPKNVGKGTPPKKKKR